MDDPDAPLFDTPKLDRDEGMSLEPTFTPMWLASLALVLALVAFIVGSLALFIAVGPR
jgi:hypothetical protein